MKHSIKALLLIIILFGCKEGDLINESDSNFASPDFMSFSNPEFKNFADLESMIFTSGSATDNTKSGGQSYFTIEKGATFSFLYSQCLTFTSLLDNQLLSIDVIVANNTRELSLDRDNSDIEEVLYMYIVSEPRLFYERQDYLLSSNGPFNLQEFDGKYVVNFNNVSAFYNDRDSSGRLTISGQVSCL